MRATERTAAAILILISVAACGEPTRPVPHIVVTVASSVGPFHVDTASDASPRISCTVTLTAEATGNVAATWIEGVIRWYGGADRATPADSATLDRGAVRGAFGRDSILPGETRTATFQLSASIPFEATMELRYFASGVTDIQRAATHFACGPTPSSGSTDRPTVGTLTVSARSTRLQPGDTIVVSYSATSAYGLMATRVDVAGPFTAVRTVNAELTKSTQPTLTFVVPQGSLLNVPVTVRVSALDGLGQAAADSATTAFVVVDTTPPSVFSAAVVHPGGIPGAPTSGQYAVGDTLVLAVSATDNNALAWLVYRMSGPASLVDSVPIDYPGKTNMQWSVPLVVRPEWVGSPQFSVYVRDAAGLASPAVTAGPALHVYPTVTPTMQTGSTVSSVFPAVFDAKRQALYFSDPDSQRVAVYSLATMSPAGTIAMPSTPAGMDLTPSGDSLVVVLEHVNSLAIVDLTRSDHPVSVAHVAVLDTVTPYSTNGPPIPRQVAIAANGKAMVFLNGETASRQTVAEYDLRTGANRMRADEQAQISDGPAGATGDRSELYVFTGACAQRYVAATDAFTPCAPATYTQMPGYSADRTGQYFTWGNVLYDAQLSPVRTCYVPSGPVALDPGGARLFAAFGNGISIGGTADGVYTERLALPSRVEEMFVSPDGSHLVAIQYQSRWTSNVYYITLP